MNTANGRAWELRTKLFELVNEFKTLQMQIHAQGATDDVQGAYGQVDAVGCELASIHDKIAENSPKYDLFTDAAQDKKDQNYAFPLSDDPVPHTFAEKLRSLREAYPMTVEELATAAGLSRQSIYSLENGTHRPTWDNVQRIAEALGVTTDAFRGG